MVALQFPKMFLVTPCLLKRNTQFPINDKTKMLGLLANQTFFEVF